jgi:hypothetical protein
MDHPKTERLVIQLRNSISPRNSTDEVNELDFYKNEYSDNRNSR